MKELPELGRLVFRRLPRPRLTDAVLGIGAAAQVTAVVGTPLVSGRLIDALALGDRERYLALLGVLVALLAIQMGLGAALGLFGALVEERVGHGLRAAVARQFLHAGPARAAGAVGDVVSRVVNDTQPVKSALMSVLVQPAVDLLTAAVAAAVLVHTSVPIGLTVLGTLPLAVIFTRRLARTLEQISMRSRGALGEMLQGMQSWLARKLWVTVFSLLPVAGDAVERGSAQVFELAAAGARVRARIGLINAAMLALPALLTLAIGGRLVLEGRLSVGSVFTLTGICGLLTTPVNRLVAVLSTVLPGLLPSYRRVAAVLAGEPGPVPPGRAPLPAATPGGPLNQVVARDVAIPLGGDRTLRVDHFCVRRGEIVALEGPNGAGKTTFLLALAGGLPLSRGSLVAVQAGGGAPLAAGVAAFSPAEAVIFDGTLMENLELFQDDVAVEEALRVWIAPAERLAALAGRRTGDELMASMSRGELQKLSLGRALLARRPLLLLDEPSQGLDAEAISRLGELLEAAKQGGPVVVATHDPALRARCDRSYRFWPEGLEVRVREERAATREAAGERIDVVP
jgi:ABC-type multidrug transport system fused ATPase/permease subunit